MSGIPAQTRFGCYIGNIDRSVTIDMLKQVFCQCGTIIDCSLNGRDGDPYRFGFIDFATEDDRARAMKYNGFTLVGRKLRVGISKGNVNKPDGFASGNPGGSSSPGHSSDRTRAPGSGESGGYNNGDGSGLTTQQQIEARLLLQFLQEGKMDPRQLSPAQQQLLIASLGHGTNNANNSMMGGGASMTPPPPLQQPPMMNSMMMMGGGGGVMPAMPQQPGMPMMPGGTTTSMNMGGVAPRAAMDGGYGNPNMMMLQSQPQQRSPQPWGASMPQQQQQPPLNAGMYAPRGGRQQTPPQQPPQQSPQQQQQLYGGSGAGVLSGGAGVNPSPSAETLRLREKQREQFFEVVRKDTEKYERKVLERRAQAAANGGAVERSDSSASDNDEKPSKKSKKETAMEAK